MVGNEVNRNARIMVVDDEVQNVELLLEIFQGEGYLAVEGTTDSGYAVEQLRREDYDLVLLDLKMPAPDGFATMEMVRKAGKTMPIMVLTSETGLSARVRSLSGGADDYLSKPFFSLEVLNRSHNLLTTYFQRRSLESDLVRQEEMLREAQWDVIRWLSRAAEFRDDLTGRHILRMGRYSQMLGVALGMQEEQGTMMFHAATMHDIGKIGVPDRILFKPGPLDEEEWRLMRRHTVIGANILSEHASPLMRMAAQVAHFHHERWDGGGYPTGLMGESIPLSARIVAVADVFDALTSARPYKKAWPIDRAVEHMKGQGGSQFDTKVLAAFMDILPNVIACRDANPDTESGP